MASEVSIINYGLTRLGADNITSRTDNSLEANAVDPVFDLARDDLLRSNQWNFATKRVQLARSARTPASEYDYQFPVPSDFLRAVVVADSDLGKTGVPYKIARDATDGTVILTDSTDLYLTYIAEVTDPNEFPPDFQTALALKIASIVATKLTNSNTIQAQVTDEARVAWLRACGSDGAEDMPDRRPEGSWVSYRSGGWFSRMWPR